MKVALVGASGNAGSELLKELVSRGHSVTAIARDTSKIAAAKNVKIESVDANDKSALADALKGNDVVISALPFSKSDPELLLAAIKAAAVPRYLVVGGAASLYAPGTTQRLVDSGQIPEEWMPEVGGGVRFFDRLKQEGELNWTFLSPSMMFVPGDRTGTFRLGKDELLVAPDGNSSISFADYAIAMVDELEQPAHSRQRFTVGY
ncbi:NAD(P)-dependent oxidoreductase [Rhizorhapis suberifaciens]|uniref:Semialdehyde dehydrogenase NAD-binding domain-containing protein n=1 Tax=Rhizorhapis suberifaciens TaxID=13656 RepID=A0A840HQV7_9SPHN|nr:NAD(P)-dependent oxidoreductase [Rhizorhapis suberifaciens]MBB4640010.1 hypothetical protein [Rhizorhapis suberifaciens]